MKQWAKGKGDAPARVDPTLAAVATTLTDIVVTLGLHERVGIGAEDLLLVLLHVAALLTIFRTVQLRMTRRGDAAEGPFSDGGHAGSA